MTKLHPYLNFAGNTEEAFSFYRSVFGSEFSAVVRFKDMPMEGVTLAKEDENKIMHIGLHIGDNVLMASDTPRVHGPRDAPGQQPLCLGSSDLEGRGRQDLQRPVRGRRHRDADRRPALGRLLGSLQGQVRRDVDGELRTTVFGVTRRAMTDRDCLGCTESLVFS
jgi:uncharacterized glyoxalase superfamily protein PhnB